MEPKFKVEGVWTEYNYVRQIQAFTKAQLFTKTKTGLIFWSIILIAFIFQLINHPTQFNIFYILFFVAMIVVSLVLQKKIIKKTYKSCKIIQNLRYSYSFFDTQLVYDTIYNHDILPYSMIHQIKESKDYIYIMSSINQTFILIKDDCGPELIEFIQTLKED